LSFSFKNFGMNRKRVWSKPKIAGRDITEMTVIA